VANGAFTILLVVAHKQPDYVEFGAIIMSHLSPRARHWPAPATMRSISASVDSRLSATNPSESAALTSALGHWT
jgi:hypothetical protein